MFDLLWYKGKDLTSLPLTERKTILKKILPENNVVRFSDSFDDGVALFEKMKEMGMEGMVAKRRDSIYKPAFRTKDWLKIPTVQRSEYVIGGWTESDSGRPFRSILFGHYVNDKFMFVGHSGSGYKERDMKDILKKLKKLEIKKNPFSNPVDHSTKAHWVKPKLVAEFQYATFTRSGKIRKPAVFMGFRSDKDASKVTKEVIKEKTSVLKPTKKKTQLSADSNWKIIDRLPVTSEDDFDIGNCRIKLTNVEKEIWKGITKADLIQYYHNISPYILAHIVDRPQSLHIKHRGPTKEGMYIKDMEGREPECGALFRTSRKHKKAGKNNIINYLVCNNEATLLWMINLGCIDVNPWTSRTSSPLYPDHIVIDLDPSDDDFSKAIETSLAAKEFFDKKKLKSFVKTSGKTGIHLFLPVNGFTFSEARSIAENICEEIHSMVPAVTTTNVSRASRGNKLYIDPNQNDEADTVAAAYSVRPNYLPTVSTPMEWSEVKASLDPNAFTLGEVVKRISRKGDLWNNVMEKKIIAENSKRLRTL